MSRLVEEGWVAPATAGPTRARAMPVVGGAVLAVLLWALLGTGILGDALDDPGARTVTLTIADDGTLGVRGKGSLEPSSEVREAGDTAFLVQRARLERAGEPLRILVDPAPGVTASTIALRVDAPGARVRLARSDEDAGERPSARVEDADPDRMHVVVTIPLSRLPDPPGADPSGRLSSVVDPLDDRIARQSADRRRLDSLRDAAPWLALLGLAPLLLALHLWRRSARSFRSMRVPGPGTGIKVEPPSSLDPVGAAVLVAGARPVDAAAAFAGHVLDLVERRQVRMRRTVDDDYGVGALLGLAHLEGDDARSEDAAIRLLRSVAKEDGVTVELPDVARHVRQPAPADRAAWRDHVTARARFERLVDRARWRPIAVAAAVLVGATLLALVLRGLMGDGPGERAFGWLVVAIAGPLGVVTTLWALEAHAWRRVTRARRHERAQWIAWCAAVGGDAAPESDERNLPLLVATGSPDVLSAAVRPDAVALTAATRGSVDSLRALAGARD